LGSVFGGLPKSLFTEENCSTQKHSSESINTNKGKTAKTATKLYFKQQNGSKKTE